jgi:hypothetical protein
MILEPRARPTTLSNPALGPAGPSGTCTCSNLKLPVGPGPPNHSRANSPDRKGAVGSFVLPDRISVALPDPEANHRGKATRDTGDTARSTLAFSVLHETASPVYFIST